MTAFRRFTATLLSLVGTTAIAADFGDTTVLPWPDGKKAAFLLAFDDGAPSQLKFAIPELEKRKIRATFYLNPGNQFYPSIAAKWEAAAKSPFVVAANHTFTHRGVNHAQELDQELAKCNEVLTKLEPDQKQRRLFGFATPGGVPWKVTKEELASALAQYDLVERPPFQGPPINFKSGEEMIAAVDKAIEKGDIGHMDFHGVGSDWLVTPLDWFIPFLDKLDFVRDTVWITDVVSWHQYVTERDTAAVEILSRDQESIRLNLTSKADPALYDHPLTLRTKAPADWTNCAIEQGETKTEVVVQNGTIQFSAVPNQGEIRLQRILKP